MGTWSNSDGLYIKFGTDRATAKAAGEYNELGPLHVLEVEIPLTSLTTSSNYFPADTVYIPSGARIEEIEVIAETAATSGGSPTLDVGLVRLDRTTAFDDDGFVAALAMTAIDAAGEKNVLRIGSTSVGALVGTTLANPGLIVASSNSTTYTAGRVVVRIYYYIP